MQSNLKSTLAGYIDAVVYILTMLAVLPYTIGDAADILPPEWKKWIAIIGLLSGGILKAIKGHVSADANPVLPSDATNQAAANEMAKAVTRPDRTGLVIVLLACLMTSCATNTGDAAKDRKGRITNAVLGEVFNAVVQVAIAEGENALSGQNGQDAAQAAFSAVGHIDAGAAIKRVLIAAAGPEVTPVARAASAAYSKADPQTPADRAAVVNTIGAAIQLVANQQL